MDISARNMLLGKVTALKPGAINAEVQLTLPGNHNIVAVVTNESVDQLGLKVGVEAFAIIKAPLVIIAKGKTDLKFSTRNTLEGTIKQVTSGSVNAEVSMELAGGVTLNSIITKQSLESMGLKAGDAVKALFKASSVILAVRA